MIWKAGAGRFPPYHPRRPDAGYPETDGASYRVRAFAAFLVGFVDCAAASALTFSHRAVTAFRPCSLNSSLLSFAARARPPLEAPSFESACAWMFFFVAMPTTVHARVRIGKGEKWGFERTQEI